MVCKIVYFHKKTYHTTTKVRYPLVVYNDVSLEKASILKNNKGKSGVYRWTNLVNSKTYVGSANDLRSRFWVYFSFRRLASSRMPIYKAILKYGYANFKL